MKRLDLIQEFFTSEQIQRAQEHRKPKPAPPPGVQLPFPMEIKMMTRGEHQRKIRNELKKKGVQR